MFNEKELHEDAAKGVGHGTSRSKIDSNFLESLEGIRLIEEVVADLDTKDMLSASPKIRMNYSEIFNRDRARKAEFARIRNAEINDLRIAASKPAKEARKREQAKARQQRRRSSLKPPEIAKIYVKPTVDVLAREKNALRAWVVEDGPQQRQWRPHVDQIMQERVMLLYFRAGYGRNPSHREFANLLTRATKTAITVGAARRRYDRLVVLDTVGPWAAAPDMASSS
ncbi:hypothetical protein [Methylobacterium sp. 77]|uniref:hypothetical protein n=1 Tax=Methylobacterium sp. 77 TaxID=1101192 RepID=UPI0012DD4AE3|nr:hypothetical protein [Methylobacterium sp. 77]